MARKRMLDPDFFLDEELSTISFEARLLYEGLWGICDDNYATLPNTPKWIKLQVFPYDEIDIAKCLKQLQDISKIVLFLDEGKEYWYIKNFFKYQSVDRPSRPKYPEFKRSKAVGIGLFQPSSIPKLSPLGEGSTSPRPEVKEVNEVKESFSSKKRDGQNGDNSFSEKKGELTKQKSWR